VTARKDKRRQEVDRFLEVYRSLGAPEADPVTQTLWIVLARHGTKEGARGASEALWAHFVDTNEFRAGSIAEIAQLIGPFVKNDPLRVAESMRGFLRRFFRDFHSMDFLAAMEKTPEGLRKYLTDPPDHAQEIGLAIFVRFCRAEMEADAAEAAAALAPAETKAKARPDKDHASRLERLRIAAAFAAYGSAPSKAKILAAHKVLADAWTYSALPDLPPPPPPPKKKEFLDLEDPDAPQPPPKAPAKAATKTPAKGAGKRAGAKPAPKGGPEKPERPAKPDAPAKEKATSRGGTGNARPRTTRAARQRATSKKSSRR